MPKLYELQIFMQIKHKKSTKYSYIGTDLKCSSIIYFNKLRMKESKCTSIHFFLNINLSI